MNFRKKISALKVPHHKNTAGMHSVRISPPKEVLLPMSMHSGGPAVPIVEVGDHVRIGQLIAREDGKISSPVHATISGTVKAIESFTPNGGRPGLAIRIIGDITKEKADTLREADAIFREEIAKAGEDKNLNQYFAVLTNTRSVGVMGDGRTYDYTLALRAVTTADFMTADWARIPYDVLDKISFRIVNEVQGINRICYDITSKPPATIEWE